MARPPVNHTSPRERTWGQVRSQVTATGIKDMLCFRLSRVLPAVLLALRDPVLAADSRPRCQRVGGWGVSHWPGHTFLIDLRRQSPCWRLASLPAAGSGWAGVACVCGGLLSNHRALLRTALAGGSGRCVAAPGFPPLFVLGSELLWRLRTRGAASPPPSWLRLRLGSRVGWGNITPRCTGPA